VYVLVLADDLIWSTRLVAHVRAAGSDAIPVRTLAAFEAGLAAADAAIVDLTARAYDGIAAVMLAASAGKRVLAVGQHDDVALRKRALAAGAERVHPYRKLFDDGPATIEKWLNPVVEASAR
jgi:fructose-1,6-bisphosphatase/inositol monophosphatase family enzyme